MSGLLVLAIVGVLVAAILCAAELIRRSRVRRLFQEQEERYQSNLSALRSEIDDLRGTLSKMAGPPEVSAQVVSTNADARPAEPLKPAAVSSATFARPPLPSTSFSQPVSLGSVAVDPFEAPPNHTEPSRPPAPASVIGFDRPKAAPLPNLVEQLREILVPEGSLEMKWGTPTGVALLVFCIGLVSLSMLVTMEPIARATVLCTVAEALTCWGLYVEAKPKCQLVARIAIAVGWVATFLFVAYTLYYVPTSAELPEDSLAFPALLVVAVAMMVLTWRFKSQLATSVSFLLAFSAVALSNDTFWVLGGGVTLAVLMVGIALYKDWLGLEVLAVVACYVNHSHWLWNVYPQIPGRPFAEFWPSTTVLVLYWLIFHIPFVARGVRSIIEERVLAVAAMFNTAFLLILMKFQSTLPPLSYFALVGLGALEFFCAVRVRGFVRIRQR